MRLDLARLPNDPALLPRVVRDLADVLERRDAELAETKAREKLQLFSALKRQRFGRYSQKYHPDQLTLSLGAIEEQIAALQAKPGPAPATAPAASPLYRQSAIYAREGVELDPQRSPTGSAGQPGCCSRWRAARGACLRRHQGARRRHAGAGARPWPRSHQERPAVGLCPRRPA
jgi:hypothetical protein